MGWKDMLFKLALFLLGVAFDWLFKAIDTDNDGYLSRKEASEFKALIRQRLNDRLQK